MRQIIITADDFGFTEKTNEGIIETVENGVTTEVNVMVNCYASKSAMKYAKAHNWQNLGLHLSIFDTSNGDLPYRGKDYDRVLSEWSSEKLLEAIKSEIATYEDYFWKTPSHINGHKQLHFNPKVVDYIFDYAKRNNLYVRKWGDFHTDTIIASDLNFIKNKFKEYEIRTSDFLFGFEYDFIQPQNSAANYEKLINQTSEESVIEILFHPGYFGDFEATLTSFLKEREADRILLCSSEFKRILQQYKLVSTNEIK